MNASSPSSPFPSAAELELDELLGLFAGLDAWHIRGVPRLDIPPLQVADCGHGITLVAPPYGSATCFPTSVGMAATWDPDLLFAVGQTLAREARAKGVGLLLGPMINLHRVPCGGRNYETFSEDPVLTGRLAAALVRGLQSEGTGACVKVFLCNNQQKNQKRMGSRVDPRALQEIYLKIFRVILAESDPWTIMTSYNPVNGAHPSDSAYWLETVLRGELGFRGVIISDWNSIQGDTALHSGLDLEMPGPGRVLLPENLRAALASGRLTLPVLQARGGRLLALHAKARPARLGHPSVSPPELDSSRHRDLARRVAENSLTLLRNENALLPLDRASLRRLAVIGPNAATARLGGGGSASVLPFFSTSPLAGITALASPSVQIDYAEGCPLGEDLDAIPASAFAHAPGVPFGRGLQGDYFLARDFADGRPPLHLQVDPVIDFSWGWAAPAHGLPRSAYAMRWTGLLRSPVSGQVTLGLSASEGIARLWLDDQLILDAWSSYDPSNFEDRYTHRRVTAPVSMRAGQSFRVVLEYSKTGIRGGLRLGWALPGQPGGIPAAAAIAAAADAAIVVVGLSNMVEGGNNDRVSFFLPGRQEELIRAVAAAKPRTVVVLIGGTPVSLENWLPAVPAFLSAYYPGQDGGTALARVLFGEINPSGKLPDTLPRSWEEIPAMQAYADAVDEFVYSEGLYVGYRHYDHAGLDPAFPFGFGLSYTTFAFDPPVLSRTALGPGQSLQVSVRVANTGTRSGRETVQLYLEPVEPELDSPSATLLDFRKIDLAPGQSGVVTFPLRYEDLLHFDPRSSAWRLLTSTFRLRAGPHSRAGSTATLQAFSS